MFTEKIRVVQKTIDACKTFFKIETQIIRIKRIFLFDNSCILKKNV